MNLTDYTYLLSKPEAVNDKQTLALDGIIAEFPYFQSARALRLKGLYNQNSFQYNYALKVTAAFTTDRSVLFDFITSDTFTAIHKGLYEQKLAELHGIEVKGIEVVVAEKSHEPYTDKVEQSILTSIKESETPAKETIPVEKMESADLEFEPKEIIEVAPEISIPTATIAAPAIISETAETISETDSPESRLDIGKPLEFSQSEKHSFQEWLQLSRIQPIDRETPVADENVTETSATATSTNDLEEQKAKKKALIDQFIKANPKIPPIKQDVKPVAAEMPFKEDTTALMTETLARVYLEQKKYQKAIQAYEILILKYPEKSTFFADRISEVKNLQQNNT